MEKYNVSENFKNLGFKFEGGKQGVTAKYVIDETKEAANGDTVRFRYMILPDVDSGKFGTVFFNVFVNKNMIHYEDYDIDQKTFSGKFCEEDAVRFVRNTMKTWNEKLGTDFSL